MFGKKQKSCVKSIRLVIDDCLYNWKAFYKINIVFIYPLWMMANSLIINILSKHVANMFYEAEKYYIAGNTSWKHKRKSHDHRIHFGAI